MKNLCCLLVVTLVIISAAGLCGCGKRSSMDSYFEMRTNALVDLNQQLAIKIPGFTKTIDCDWSKLNGDAGDFDVAAEFVNHVGGIDRTNLPVHYCSRTNADHSVAMLCYIDDNKITARQIDAFLAAHPNTPPAAPAAGEPPTTNDPAAINPATGEPYGGMKYLK